MSKAINERLDDIIYEKVKVMPKDEQKEVLDFVDYLIQKRLKIVKDMFETTKETKQVLERYGYTEDNISELVKEIRGIDD
ncbi:accessory colonization factor AcfC [Thermoanaerobacterium butyriciformans]|uniref:Accessory colonization factor AcfC n=2 Tax=Thermoanaerobacterium butyriciformans TaxID=1702242 RepID=A0ABS4NDE2_9THEO|nr:accessory colonization factor AcfC [Thermoanaerobacterium butyriciformans]